MADALFDRALELVMDAGQTLLENGGEVFRAQQTMEIMAASLGVRDFHVYVLTNGIFASAHLPGRDAVSLVRHVPTVSVHLGRVEAVNELSRELAAGRLGVVEAEARLNTARSWKFWPALSGQRGSPTFSVVRWPICQWRPSAACWNRWSAGISPGTASTGSLPTSWRRSAAPSGLPPHRRLSPLSVPTRPSSARLWC